MPSGTNTPNLDLLRIQAMWQFGDEAFNRFIDDADNKLVGVSHLINPMHWTEWKESTLYSRYDIVRYPNLKSHQYAVCLEGGTSSTTVPTNNITGSIVTDGTVKWHVLSLSEAVTNGGTIKIWLGGNVYSRGDAVRYGDALYRAILDHTADSDFSNDANKWQEIYASVRFWKANTYYYLNDTAIYDNTIYKCIRAHKSISTFDTVGSITGDDVDWELITDAGGAKDWTTSTTYQYGQLVLVNGILYRCNTKHISDSTSFSNDILNWDLVKAQIKDWVTGEYYVAGTLVAYNNIIYKCLTNHTASVSFTTDISNWVLYHNTITIWATNTSYYVGQIVIYSGSSDDYRIYRCNTNHVSSTFISDASKWNPLDASIAVWKSNTAYVNGDVVLYNNEPFRCLQNHTSSSGIGASIFDDITSSVSTNCWDYIGQRNPFILPWAANKTYNVNQVITYNDTLFRCNTLHTSSSIFDATKFDLLYANIQTWATGIYYMQNTLVIHDGNLYLCLTAHTSTTFSADASNWIQIGAEGTINNWASSVAYAANQVVLYNGTLYRSTVAHTSSSTFDTDLANWQIINSSIPVWSSSTAYKVGQVVIYNNILYRNTVDHLSSSSFATDEANWTLLGAVRNWTASTFYKAGEIIKYEDVLYLVNTSHTSSSTFSFTNLSLLNITRLLDWQANKWYAEGSVVLYNDILYVCTTSHQSLSTFQSDNSNWKLVNAKIQDWVANTYYTAGTYVNYNDKIYKCLINNSRGIVPPYLGYYWKEVSNRGISLWRKRRSQLSVNNITSLLHFETDVLLDEIYTNSWYRTYGDGSPPTLDTTDPKIGNGCASLQHWGRKMRCDNVLNIFGTTDLRNVVATIEFWGKSASPGMGGNGVGEFFTIMRPNAGGQTIISTDDFLDPKPSIMNWNEWAHIAMVFNNSLTYKVYINGTYLGDYPIPDSDVMATINGIEIGNGHLYQYTHMDEFIITRGVKYTGDFTPSETQLDIGLYGYYEVEDYVEYDSKIYRCIERNADNDFDINKWELVTSGTGNTSIEEWSTSTYYELGQIVLYNNNLYKCTLTHTSSSSSFGDDGSNWEFIGSIDTWTTGIYYPYHILAVNDGKLYRCIVAHTSTAVFDDTKWEELSSRSTGYQQVNAYGVTATSLSPYTIDIPISPNISHTLYPTDVLKYKDGSGTSITETMMDFVESDASKFNNTDYVSFKNSVLKVNQKVEVALGSASSLGTGYLRISDPIDLNNNYKSVERVVCS